MPFVAPPDEHQVSRKRRAEHESDAQTDFRRLPNLIAGFADKVGG
jgi:hypothetical protein